MFISILTFKLRFDFEPNRTVEWISRVYQNFAKFAKSWTPQANSESTRKTKNFDTYIIVNGLDLSVRGFIKVY